jgi:hypothetical protein
VLHLTLNRRRALEGAALAFTLAAAPRALARSGSAPLAFDTPRENVRTMARLTSTLEPGKTGHVRYRGAAFGLLPDGRNVPLYDVDGLGALRALPQADGSIRFLFNEFALYLDPVTKRPLERWTNPLTGRSVEVWHNRNGPVNYTLDPAKAMFGAFARADGSNSQGFSLPWVMRGPFATFALDVVADRKNPLTPDKWPLESTGPTLPTTEHSQYAVLRRDLENPKLLSLPFFATLQSIKPWHPWMLMGKTPGRVFARLVAEKVESPDVLPAELLRFARANLAPFLDAPATWTGEYVTQHAIYMKDRSPAR